MTYNIITTQPQIFTSFLQTGLISRGLDKKIIKINIINLYDYGIGVHKKIDDTPYGGGAGMVIRVDVLDKALSKFKSTNPRLDRLGRKKSKVKIILLTPQGKIFTQESAKKLAKMDEIVLISGRFEGYDERIRNLVDEEVSIGDYVLTSGDLPALVLIDAISRQIPGFIDRKESIEKESFEKNLLEFPQYTRPYEYIGKKTPSVLLSGHHAQIASWRRVQSLKKTGQKRPDMKK
ncbi:MAG: ine37 [Candidatus Berkelbacteria bacterium]|nr:ine37 [Candidatus Berkelbacteria bacterium]